MWLPLFTFCGMPVFPSSTTSIRAASRHLRGNRERARPCIIDGCIRNSRSLNDSNRIGGSFFPRTLLPTAAGNAALPSMPASHPLAHRYHGLFADGQLVSWLMVPHLYEFVAGFMTAPGVSDIHLRGYWNSSPRRFFHARPRPAVLFAKGSLPFCRLGGISRGGLFFSARNR